MRFQLAAGHCEIKTGSKMSNHVLFPGLNLACATFGATPWPRPPVCPLVKNGWSITSTYRGQKSNIGSDLIFTKTLNRKHINDIILSVHDMYGCMYTQKMNDVYLECVLDSVPAQRTPLKWWWKQFIYIYIYISREGCGGSVVQVVATSGNMCCPKQCFYTLSITVYHMLHVSVSSAYLNVTPPCHCVHPNKPAGPTQTPFGLAAIL